MTAVMGSETRAVTERRYDTLKTIPAIHNQLLQLIP